MLARVHDLKNKNEMRWRWAAFLLAAAGFGVGCNPAAMTAYMIAPFHDNRLPAECPLKSEKKEVTVVVRAFNSNLEVRDEFWTADRQLASLVGQHLQQRFKANKDKIKIVPAHQVRSFLHKHYNKDLLSAEEIGKEFKADYVINLEINRLTMYKQGSYHSLYEGGADIFITVFKTEEPGASYWERAYRTEYPPTGPTDVTDMNPTQFRAAFMKYVAHEITRFFAPHAPEETRMSSGIDSI